MDTRGLWYESLIVDVDEQQVFVKYNGWSEGWNDWIPKCSPRLAPVQHIKWERGASMEVRHPRGMVLECILLEVEEDRVYVHYKSWSNTWDEWIDRSSHRLNPVTLQAPFSLEKGASLDVQDTAGTWFESVILETKDNLIKVQYKGWPHKWDEWIPRTSPRLSFLNQFSQKDWHLIREAKEREAAAKAAAI